MLAAGAASNVAVSDVERLPFCDAAFDAALALMMLYHVPDQRAAAAELRRVVRPGGMLVATTASQYNQSELRDLIERVIGGGWTWQRPSTTSFHLEGGADVLGSAFETVEVVDAPERRIFITDPDAMADYVASASEHFERTLPPAGDGPRSSTRFEPRPPKPSLPTGLSS